MNIAVRQCMIGETEWFRKLEGEYHYMGESHGAGDVVRLVFEENGRPVALMTWAASCYRLKARDERIGWNPAMRAARLKLVVNNRRYTELVPKGSRPNLASHVLGLAIRELPAIWERQWGYRPLLAETFCDIERAAGTCYRAAGWEEVGKTKGFSRVGHARDFYVPNGRPKVLYMKPFRKDAWDMIVSSGLPPEHDVAAHSKADGVLPFKPEQVEGLHWELCHVKDPRGSNRSIGIGPLLAIFTMACAAGAKDLKAAHGFARRLSNAQLRELGCPKAKDALGNEVWGKYVCPSYTAFYNLLRHKDKAGRYDFDVADYAAHLSRWMTAQHGKLPRHLAADGKFIDEVVGLVSVVDAESGDVVAVAPASKKEGLKGRCEYPVLRKTLAGMDLSGAVVSTDALSCQDDTAHTVLAEGGDCVLQVKANRKGLLEQCGKPCRIRPLVSSSKKRAEPGTLGDPRDEGVPRHRPCGRWLPRSADDRSHLPGGVADAEDGEEGSKGARHPQDGRQADEGGRLPRLVARPRLADGGEVRGDRAHALVRRGMPRQARQRLPRGRVHAALRRERHGGDDGGAVVRDVDMRTAPGADDGAGEERPVPPSGEARADHDERRTAMT